MQVFSTTLNRMLVLFLFIALGFLMNKKRVLPQNSATVLSKLETNVLVPCLVFNTFYKYCTPQNFSQKWTYILYGAVIMALSLVIGIFLTRLFTKDDYLKRIYRYSFAARRFCLTT